MENANRRENRGDSLRKVIEDLLDRLIVADDTGGLLFSSESRKGDLNDIVITGGMAAVDLNIKNLSCRKKEFGVYRDDIQRFILSFGLSPLYRFSIEGRVYYVAVKERMEFINKYRLSTTFTEILRKVMYVLDGIFKDIHGRGGALPQVDKEKLIEDVLGLDETYLKGKINEVLVPQRPQYNQ